MARTISDDFAPIIARAHARLTQVSVEEESDPTRAILTVQGYYGEHRILIRETVAPSARRYAYYILLGDRVLLGLDNHADRQALRLKFGKDFSVHLHELIPHRHGSDKSTTELTGEWTAEQFLDELDSLVESINNNVGRC